MVHFSSAIVLAAVASAASIVKRDVAAVLANLAEINYDTTALTAAIVAWDGSLLGAVGIQGGVTTLEGAITSATTETQTEAPATSADSTTILNYVSDTITPDLTASLDALVAREAEFATLGLTDLVVQDLQTLQTDTDALGAALLAIASSDTQAQGATTVSAIDTAFASAIAVFSG